VRGGIQSIVAEIKRHTPGGIEEYELRLGLPAPNPEFRRALVDAVSQCVRLQCKPPPTRRAIREELTRVSRAASTVRIALLKLDHALDNLTPQPTEWLAKTAARLNMEFATLPAQATKFDELSAIALRHERMLKVINKGGAPKMVAFGALVTGLARAFKIATGHPGKVTFNHVNGTYGGKFLEFVEVVLPLARHLTEYCKAQLRYPPSPKARGRFVYELTRAGKKSRHRFLMRNEMAAWPMVPNDGPLFRRKLFCRSRCCRHRSRGSRTFKP
jgi:hypothetical protein